MDEERFDTWTRSELLAARGYDIPSKASPAPATNGSATSRSGTSALTISEARPESPNGSASHTTEEPGAAAGAPVPVAVHGSENLPERPRGSFQPRSATGGHRGHQRRPRNLIRRYRARQAAPAASAVDPCRRATTAVPSGSPVRLAAPSSVTTVSATTVSGTRRRAPR